MWGERPVVPVLVLGQGRLCGFLYCEDTFLHRLSMCGLRIELIT